MHPFRNAIENGELDAALELFSPNVVFNSPVVFGPYHGREALGLILHAVVRVFRDFHYEREIGEEGAGDHALLFKARVGDRELHGCDFLHTDQDGLIDEMSVMVRPLSAALALKEAMQAEILAVEREQGVEAAEPRRADMNLKLEVVQVPVADVDRAKAFYADQVGFHADHDTQVSETIRVVQLTPPGSACSIVLGTGLSAMAPGSIEGLQLTVTDMASTHSALAGRGVEVSEVENLGRPGGPSFKHAHFSDPDGNRWVLQELPDQA